MPKPQAQPRRGETGRFDGLRVRGRGAGIADRADRIRGGGGSRNRSGSMNAGRVCSGSAARFWTRPSNGSSVSTRARSTRPTRRPGTHDRGPGDDAPAGGRAVGLCLRVRGFDRLADQCARLPHPARAGRRHAPSACPACKTRLGWRENIPILGWILLRGQLAGPARPRSLRNTRWLKPLSRCCSPRCSRSGISWAMRHPGSGSAGGDRARVGPRGDHGDLAGFRRPAHARVMPGRDDPDRRPHLHHPLGRSRGSRPSPR